jgi:hypothetical protein
VIEFHFRPVKPAAVADSLFAAGVVDENAPHGLGGGGKEMPAPVPLLRLARVNLK